jgi:hypothetical protein
MRQQHPWHSYLRSDARIPRCPEPRVRAGRPARFAPVAEAWQFRVACRGGMAIACVLSLSAKSNNRVAPDEVGILTGVPGVMCHRAGFDAFPGPAPAPSGLFRVPRGDGLAMFWRTETDGPALRACLSMHGDVAVSSGQRRRANRCSSPSPRNKAVSSCPQLTPALDDDHSSRRRARDRCIAGVVRESVQLEVGVEVQQRCLPRQSVSTGRAT